MTPNSASQQLVIIHWGGINATQTCGLNVSPHLLLPLSQVGFHVLIVVSLATTLRTVLFAPHLHDLLISDQWSEEHQSTLMTELQYARTLITPDACEHPAGTCTSVTTVEVTTLIGHAPRKGTCTRPHLWTPLWMFILEWELSNHPDKAFVRQLIHDLQYGWLPWTTICSLSKKLCFHITAAKSHRHSTSKRVRSRQNSWSVSAIPLAKLSLIRFGPCT